MTLHAETLKTESIHELLTHLHATQCECQKCIVMKRLCQDLLILHEDNTRLQLIAKSCLTYQNKEFWVWEGDGQDHLDTIICPVLIQPKEFLKIIRTVSHALKASVDWCQQEVPETMVVHQGIQALQMVRKEFGSFLGV